ncbi:MAG TPA: ceramidase domain-containing protein [Candidatus Eisenbacteria bacterium]|nr:ceramidase domain-containing protein [Candidatus Eisenbacteria bacterium]
MASLALAWAGYAGWSGDAYSCVANGRCFCEHFRGGPIVQPVNTWSCAAFVVAGMLCAVHAMRNHDPRGGRMASTLMHPALFTTSLALMGPASMALHASMTEWGGHVDRSSMHVFAAYCLSVGLSRRFSWSETKFWIVFCLASLLPIGLRFIPNAPIRGEFVFGAGVGMFVLNEILPEGRTRSRDLRWRLASLACLVAGIIAWVLSVGDAGPWCTLFGSRGFLQGHALWHCLSAAAAACLYPHFRQEPRLCSDGS